MKGFVEGFTQTFYKLCFNSSIITIQKQYLGSVNDVLAWFTYIHNCRSQRNLGKKYFGDFVSASILANTVIVSQNFSLELALNR